MGFSWDEERWVLMVGLLSLFLIKVPSLLKLSLNLGLEMPGKTERVTEMWNRVVGLHMEFICLLPRFIDRTIPMYPR